MFLNQKQICCEQVFGPSLAMQQRESRRSLQCSRPKRTMAEECLVVLARDLRAFLRSDLQCDPDDPCSSSCPFCAWSSPSLQALRCALAAEHAAPVHAKPEPFHVACAWIWARRMGAPPEPLARSRRRRRSLGTVRREAFALGRGMLRDSDMLQPDLPSIQEDEEGDTAHYMS